MSHTNGGRISELSVDYFEGANIDGTKRCIPWRFPMFLCHNGFFCNCQTQKQYTQEQNEFGVSTKIWSVGQYFIQVFSVII